MNAENYELSEDILHNILTFWNARDNVPNIQVANIDYYLLRYAQGFSLYVLLGNKVLSVQIVHSYSECVLIIQTIANVISNK